LTSFVRLELNAGSECGPDVAGSPFREPPPHYVPNPILFARSRDKTASTIALSAHMMASDIFGEL
jgi:hypothetical protein